MLALPSLESAFIHRGAHLHASALTPLPRQGAVLAHLDSLLPRDLVLWTDGFVSFPFGKGGSGVLANCSLCGTEATFSFLAGPVCSSFSAEACTILHACWSRQHQQACYFSSLPFFLLPDTLCLLSPPVLSGYNGSPDTRFTWRTTRLTSWPDGERYLRPLQSLSSDWRRTVSPNFFDTQVPSISTEELVLPRHARCSLVFAATDTAFC